MVITNLRILSEGIFKDLISLDMKISGKKPTNCVNLHAISRISFSSESVQERPD